MSHRIESKDKLTFPTLRISILGVGDKPGCMQAGTPALPGKNAACTSAMDVLERVGKQRVNSDADY
jgi:hypothetical protein